MKNIDLIRALLAHPMDAEIYLHSRANALGKHLDAPIGVDSSVEKHTGRLLLHIWGQTLVMKSPLPLPRINLPPAQWGPWERGVPPEEKPPASRAITISESTTVGAAPEPTWPDLPPEASAQSYPDVLGFEPLPVRTEPFPVRKRPAKKKPHSSPK